MEIDLCFLLGLVISFVCLLTVEMIGEVPGFENLKKNQLTKYSEANTKILCSILFEKQRKADYESALRRKLEFLSSTKSKNYRPGVSCPSGIYHNCALDVESSKAR